MKIKNGLKLILGSSSKSRRLVLEKAGFDFEVMAADIDEKAIRHDDYSVMPLLIANAKADALLPRIAEPAILVTADQVSIFDGEFREKPVSKDEARKYLKSYTSDKSAETISAVVVVNTQNGNRCDGVDIAKTYFKQMPDDIFVTAQYEPKQEKIIKESISYKVYIVHPRMIAVENINLLEVADFSVLRDLDGKEVALVLYSHNESTERAIFLTARELKVDDSQKIPQWAKEEISRATNDMVDVIIVLSNIMLKDENHDEMNFNGPTIIEIRADI